LTLRDPGYKKTLVRVWSIKGRSVARPPQAGPSSHPLVLFPQFLLVKLFCVSGILIVPESSRNIKHADQIQLEN